MRRGLTFGLANQKGGVGKTTCAVNLASALADLGYEVLLVDCDPQGNATTALGVTKSDVEASLYEVLSEEAPVESALMETEVDRLKLIPATLELAGAEVELVSAISRETRLRRALEPIRCLFDAVLLDCPPSLGILTVNAMAASRYLLIPVQCEFFALEGLAQLKRTIALVKSHVNPELEVGGVLLTMFDSRTRISREVADEVRSIFGDKVFSTVIPRSVKLSEAPSHGLPISRYAPKSPGAESFASLAEEVAQRWLGRP